MNCKENNEYSPAGQTEGQIVLISARLYVRFAVESEHSVERLESTDIANPDKRQEWQYTALI